MLYRFLSSLKTSVYVLVFLCILFLIGTIFPQGENIDDYIEAGGKYITIVRALDFLDIFMSPLFIAATFLLLINLALCLYDRLKIYLKIKRRPMDFQALKQHAKVITFNKAFQATPAIGIGAQDLQTGDYYTLSSKSRTGFTITFYNSSDTAISRTFDYVAKGYGREVT